MWQQTITILAHTLLFQSIFNMPVPFSVIDNGLLPVAEATTHKQPAFAHSLRQRRSVPKEQHLILVGGGHAHVQVIKALNAQARPPRALTRHLD